MASSMQWGSGANLAKRGVQGLTDALKDFLSLQKMLRCLLEHWTGKLVCRYPQSELPCLTPLALIPQLRERLDHHEPSSQSTAFPG